MLVFIIYLKKNSIFSKFGEQSALALLFYSKYYIKIGILFSLYIWALMFPFWEGFIIPKPNFFCVCVCVCVWVCVSVCVCVFITIQIFFFSCVRFVNWCLQKTNTFNLSYQIYCLEFVYIMSLLHYSISIITVFLLSFPILICLFS